MGMIDPGRDREKELAYFIRWAESQPAVRAALLTSTLAIPGGTADIFSDYDIILVLTDIRPFHAERAWLEAFAPVLALFRDPLEVRDGFLQSGYVIQFSDGLKIDFSLWPVEMMQEIAAAPVLMDELDAGYRVLIDKDHLTDGMKPPSYQAFIPKPPTEEEYRVVLENFFVAVVYAAKYLWRDDLMAAKFIISQELIEEELRPMFEWHYEIQHGWSVKPGPHGRGMKKWLRPDLWAGLESIFVGAGLEENWSAVFRAVELMRKTATEVGNHLGFAYPEEVDRGTTALIEQMKKQAH